MKIFSSPFLDPYKNLAIEDYLLRKTQIDKPFLFLYKNSPCVVWGRFQNPWIECNLDFCLENALLPVRRQSGGGCVYQDLGNINFSFHHPTKELNKSDNIQLIIQTLQLCGLENISFNQRHDIIVDQRKCSGSAYKQTKDASFHHGTLLFDADLEKLDACLHSSLKSTDSKSIPSVRSRVINLSEKNIFEEAFLDELQRVCETVIVSIEHYDEAVYQQLKSNEWIWNETPFFKLELEHHSKIVLLESHKGKITKMISDGVSREVANGIDLPVRSDEIKAVLSALHK